MNISFRPAAQPTADATLLREVGMDSPRGSAGGFAASADAHLLQTHAI